MAWVTQGRIADRTREHLGAVDRGVIMLRQMFFDQMERVQRGEDPINVFRGPGDTNVIDLPQEREKFGQGSAYLSDVLSATQARFSPRRDEILRRFAEAGLACAG
jgi:5,5'-dehydrodivanillate O-demethylase oxygenase subunit